jgi:Rrf2 family iron-sulfur cluster assembly transcriptional regulator
MLSNSCRYGIRAIIYIASKQKGNNKTGIKQISKDLDLPTPFLAKILQQLAILEIVKIIDGEEIFTDCLIHNTTCACVDKRKAPCPLHDDYAKVRSELINLFSGTTVHELVLKAGAAERILI